MAFKDLGVLYYLDLGENDLVTMHGDIWVGRYSLETIRIYHNPLNTKSSVRFPNLPDLRLVLVDLVILKALNKELSAPANYPDTKTQPKLGLEEDKDLPCDNSMCWLKKLEDKGLMAHYKRNGEMTRPKCENKSMHWDEYSETLNCSGKRYIITVRKRSLGQRNVFTHVCHSVHGAGRCIPACNEAGVCGRHPS